MRLARNSDPSGVADVAKSPIFNAFIARAEKEYQALSPTPDQYKPFLGRISKMWETQPNWTAENLRAITVPTWIVDADHDEAIKRENTEFMAANIPGAGLLLQPQVSHFSFIQDPEQFNRDVLHFLEHADGWLKRESNWSYRSQSHLIAEVGGANQVFTSPSSPPAS